MKCNNILFLEKNTLYKVVKLMLDLEVPPAVNVSKLLCKHVGNLRDGVNLALKLNLISLWNTHKCILKLLNVLKHSKVTPKRSYIGKRYGHAFICGTFARRLVSAWTRFVSCMELYTYIRRWPSDSVPVSWLWWWVTPNPHPIGRFLTSQLGCDFRGLLALMVVRLVGRGEKSRQVVEGRDRRNKVSCKVRPQPQVLDTEVRRVFRTSEEMQGGVGVLADTLRAGNWCVGVENVLKNFQCFTVALSQLRKGCSVCPWKGFFSTGCNICSISCRMWLGARLWMATWTVWGWRSLRMFSYSNGSFVPLVR